MISFARGLMRWWRQVTGSDYPCGCCGAYRPGQRVRQIYLNRWVYVCDACHRLIVEGRR